VLTSHNIISVYDIEMKNSATKYTLKICKETKIDTERNQLIKLNLIENSIKVNPLSEMRRNFSPFEILSINSNILSSDINSQNLLISLSSEDKEKLKEEAFLIINDLLENEDCTQNIENIVTNIFENKLEKMFLNIQSKLKENIINLTNEMDKTLYEENLLSRKLENISELYENLSIKN
jgi:hypothetical protein